MRPVERGAAPAIYTHHGQARHNLSDRIGYYCSYCEMGVNNMIEVEHIHPMANGGNPVAWNNFLLSCKYCNTVKSNHNPDRVGFFWPDIDNTDLAFDYSEVDVIKPKTTLAAPLTLSANATISLMGLDRKPGGANEPTEADTRWIIKDQAWSSAKLSYNNWIKLPVQVMAEQIGITSLVGNYSIWREVFKDVPIVLTEIDNAYLQYGLFKQFNPGTTVRVIRPTGNI